MNKKNDYFESPVINSSVHKNFSDKITNSETKNQENFIFFTPQHVNNLNKIDSLKTTPDDLQKIFSPPPGFLKFKQNTSRKLNFIDECEENTGIGPCENCKNIINSDNLERNSAVTQVFKEINEISALEHTFSSGKNISDSEFYIKQLQVYIRKLSLTHAKEKIEIIRKHSVETSENSKKLALLERNLTQDLKEKDKIITNLLSKIQKYDSNFVNPVDIKTCIDCIKLNQELKSKNFQIDELRNYIKNIDPQIFACKEKCLNERFVKLNRLKEVVCKEFESGQCKNNRRLIFEKIIKIEKILQNLPETNEKTVLLDDFKDLPYCLKPIFETCRKLESLQNIN